MYRNVPGGVNDFFHQFVICEISDVFSLDSGINDHFFLMDHWIEEINQQFQKTFHTFFADPFMEVGQV